MPRRPVSLRALVPAAVASLSACGLYYPEVQDDRLVMLAALNPDSAEHRVLLWPVSQAAEPPLATARLYRGTPHAGGLHWTLVATATEHGRQCRAQPYYLSFRTNYVSLCLVPGAQLDAGTAYMVEASAEGYRTARGHTLAVGDFEVEKAVLTRAGAPARLDASWTGSVAAHRYFVALRRLHPPYLGNPKGWYVEAEGTSVATPVPASAINDAIVPILLDVAALSKDLHAYLASGTGGSVFSVPPVQNIENGFGFVGSLRVRSRPVSSK